MKCLAASCDSCGAPLEIPVRARQVTCRHCDTSLEVVRTDSTVTTRMLERLTARVDRAERELARLGEEAGTRPLDEGWKRFCESYALRGVLAIPSVGWSRGLLIAASALLAAAVMAAALDHWVWFLLCAFAGAPLFAVGAARLRQARRFSVAREQYRSHRRKVIAASRAGREEAAG